MLFLWRGYGFLIPIVIFFNSLISELISESITKDDNIYQTNLIPLGLSLVVSAYVLWLIDKHFKKDKPKVYIEKETGKEVVLKREHDFFFVPFLYWSYFVAAIAVIVVVVQLSR